MSSPSYLAPGLTLSVSATSSPAARDLQRDLRSLGYLAGPIDGVFGNNTRNCVMALQFDLMNNTGASSQNDGNAPVAIQSYNQGRVTAASGVLDQGLAACMADMLADANYPKLPFSADPAADNQAALAAIAGTANPVVPVPFLMQILMQESNQMHYRVPSGSNIDNFVTIGLDHNNSANPTAITSRGYGIGQFTLFHHPPAPAEVAGVITDPVQNVQAAIAELRGKFDRFVNGPTDTADDRQKDFGNGPLRQCKYDSADPLFMKDCANCCRAAGTFNIVSGVTPVYDGAALTYAQTQYHKGSYTGVPVRANIPCDWPYAIRRYNGSGVNSYDYQAEVLWRIIQ